MLIMCFKMLVCRCAKFKFYIFSTLNNTNMFFLKADFCIGSCKVCISLVYFICHFSLHCVLCLLVVMLQRTASCVSRRTTVSFAHVRLH